VRQRRRGTGRCWRQTLVSIREESITGGVVSEPPGPNCAAGGNEVMSGLDSNHNGVLDASEVTSRSYVCNGGSGASGSAGATGMMSLVEWGCGGIVCRRHAGAGVFTVLNSSGTFDVQ
jgi:hypothetical protein